MGVRCALGALCLTACGGNDAPVDVDPPACPPPSRIVAERCLEPGVQDNGCPAGTLSIDGACVPAGVPPSSCPPGFEAANDGCSPILPPMRCGDGLMAVPGDLECHEPSDCGEGRWGNIPIEANTVFVDGSYLGTIVLGTETQPFTTIVDAAAAAPQGGLIAIAAGSYVGSVFVAKGLRVWGRCASLVEIVASPDLPSAVLDSDASELHGVALGGDSSLVITGALDVVLDGVWIHDTDFPGLQ